eukprot:TRINITY_DN1505_c0_g1_i3.p1 TRINITY_DN1505_c0_g1~~TRINITY_DN1505_c0_g1_i3.p1  ORF type:complete len:861 (-),score=116.74 TRINITY_DN1505_c0_g1_i3:524-3106(-)
MARTRPLVLIALTVLSIAALVSVVSSGRALPQPPAVRMDDLTGQTKANQAESPKAETSIDGILATIIPPSLPLAIPDVSDHAAGVYVSQFDMIPNSVLAFTTRRIVNFSNKGTNKVKLPEGVAPEFRGNEFTIVVSSSTLYQPYEGKVILPDFVQGKAPDARSVHDRVASNLKVLHSLVSPDGNAFVSLPDVNRLCRLVERNSLSPSDLATATYLLALSNIDASTGCDSHSLKDAFLSRTQLKRAMEDAGFEHVQNSPSDFPLGALVSDPFFHVTLDDKEVTFSFWGKKGKAFMLEAPGQAPKMMGMDIPENIEPKSYFPLLHASELKSGRSLPKTEKNMEAIINHAFKSILATPHVPAGFDLIRDLYLALNNNAIATRYARTSLWIKDTPARRSALAGQLSRTGKEFADKSDWTKALVRFEAAKGLDPSLSKYHYQTGVVYASLQNYRDALTNIQEASRLDPTNHQILHGLASVAANVEAYNVSLAAGKKLLRMGTKKIGFESMVRASGVVYRAAAEICEWKDYHTVTKFLLNASKKCLQTDKVLPDIDPGSAVYWGNDLSPSELVRLGEMRSREYVHQARDIVSRLGSGAFKAHPTTLDSKGRLKIAFLFRFGKNPVTHLLQVLFRLLDQDRFDLYCYDFLPPQDEDYMQDRIRDYCKNWGDSHYIDVSEKDDVATATEMRDAGLHVAFDIAGWTGEARPLVYALRPAPLQVTFLGFPGSSGSPWMDYLLVDEVTVPKDVADAYSEKVLYIDSPVMVNDQKESYGAVPMEDEAATQIWRDELRCDIGRLGFDSLLCFSLLRCCLIILILPPTASRKARSCSETSEDRPRSSPIPLHGGWRSYRRLMRPMYRVFSCSLL